MANRENRNHGNSQIDYGNSVLYGMCEGDNIWHVNPDTVAGKMWLIGRSYAASPERQQGKVLNNLDEGSMKKPKINTDTDFFRKVAQIIVRNQESERLDGVIRQMRNVEYTYDFTKDADVLKGSIELVKLLNEMIMMASNQYNKENYVERLAKNNVSFASKYLHIHLPNVIYIMDTYSLINGKNKHKEMCLYDKDYAKLFKTYKDIIPCGYAEHTLRCYFIAQKLDRDGEDCYPRAVDDILMLRGE